MDDDDYDSDGYMGDGDNYIWVEDGYAMADDLAEMVVPDPSNGAGDVEWDDLTRFDFWYDIEYDSDGYQDGTRRPSKRRARKDTPTRESVAVNGRKRKAPSGPQSASKKARVDPKARVPLSELPPVVFMPTAPPKQESTEDVRKMKSYAILPDWRENINHTDIVAVAHPLSDEDLEHAEGQAAENDADEADEPISMMALKMALQAGLTSKGIDASAIDETALLRLATSMMSRSDDTDMLFDELIEGIQGGEEDDDARDPFAEWVSQTANESVGQQNETESAEVNDADREESHNQRATRNNPRPNDRSPVLRSAGPSQPRGRKRRASSAGSNQSSPTKRKTKV